MAAPIRQHPYTPDEYLAHERQAAYKSEYIAGQIVAIGGVSWEHSLINGNLVSLRNTDHDSALRVKVRAQGQYTYPDIVVVCREPQFEETHVDTLLNPTPIVEVLSPSTEAYDRGAKYGYYRALPSVQEYLLVAQDEICTLPLAEVYRKVVFPADPPAPRAAVAGRPRAS